MKKIEISRYGDPEEVVSCVEGPDIDAPNKDEVVFDVLAFPINPADVAFCQGNYRLKPPLPTTPGAECVGRIIAVGSDVNAVSIGDIVINLERENWAQQRRVKATSVIKLPSNINLTQAAMIRINPPTVRLLLQDIVTLSAGDWIIQNVGNSAVGRQIIALAKHRGIRTINIVRRADVFDDMYALGADVCLLDGDDLQVRADKACDGAAIVLGIDAISGSATARIAGCVAENATVCTYGSMSGLPASVPSFDLIYRGITFTGFMLGRFLAKYSTAEIEAIYAEIADDVASGRLQAPVDKIYPIDDIKIAIRHAQSPGHYGKILIAPNGMDVR
ncbi:MAG: 2-enoyl thioester reductase domain-containing protein [Sneathiella sp.]|uniref:MDR family NADPH-dependent oxidoreductase n=1 Tax=Sneathiella sp. TaxID=1964365 RepID=UPI0030019DDB